MQSGPQISADSALLFCVLGIVAVLGMVAFNWLMTKRSYRQKDAFVRELRK